MKETLSQQEQRRDFYKLLADCFYLPDEKLLKTLSDLDKTKDSFHSELAGNTHTLDNIEELRIDFSKLFVGPFRLLAPPYGSVYMENGRTLMGESTLDVINRYREVGLDISENLYEAPDHIAVELEFMYFLVCRESEAISRSDFEMAASYQQNQRSFLECHLGRWVLEFTDNIEANAETEFYKYLACLTRSFITKDLQSLSEN